MDVTSRCLIVFVFVDSLVCYLLQIKDRHNGNVLLDRHGHIIHIDYGFMLSSSPGQLGFESAPFKLTQYVLTASQTMCHSTHICTCREMVDVLGGVSSEFFHYFQVLLLRGFLELRRHSRRIVTLVRLMGEGSQLSCFSAGVDETIDALRARLQLGLSERECAAHVLDLVVDSFDSWKTTAFDYYQYLTNSRADIRSFK